MYVVSKTRYIFILLFCLGTRIGLSQQDPQFAHNASNLLFVNPGSAGMSDGICATVINRQQWLGFEGAPKTTLAGIHAHLNLFGISQGVGLSIADDRLGFSKDFRAKLTYSFHQRIGNGVLGIGIEGGIFNKNLDGQWKYPDADGSQDPFVTTEAARKMVLDLGAGIFYKIGEKFYAGISAAHLHQPEISYPKVKVASFLRRNYYGIVGYKFRLLNSPIELNPSIFAKFDGTKLQYSGNISGTYNKKITLGVSYRNLDAFIPMLSIQLITGLRVGYAYELSLSKMIKASNGSHEFMIGYCFDFYKTTKKYKYKSILYL